RPRIPHLSFRALAEPWTIPEPRLGGRASYGSGGASRRHRDTNSPADDPRHGRSRGRRAPNSGAETPLLGRNPHRSRVSAVSRTDVPWPGPAFLGPGLQGIPPRREPARVLLVATIRRAGLRTRPDDARAVAVRV